MPSVLKLTLDLGPLIVFFATYEFFGIFAATGVFMAAMLLVLAIGYARERKLLPMPAVTAALVLVFGGLTLILRNDVFIKMKPTVLYAIFAVLLAGGLGFKRLFIKYVFGEAWHLTDEAWRALTWRWAAFFMCLAFINELVWRNFSTGTWVAFKVWGILPLVLLFGVAQAPFLMRHQIESGKAPPSGG